MSREYWEKILACEKITHFLVSLTVELPVDTRDTLPDEIALLFTYCGYELFEEGTTHFWSGFLSKQELQETLFFYGYSEKQGHYIQDFAHFVEGKRLVPGLEFSQVFSEKKRTILAYPNILPLSMEDIWEVTWEYVERETSLTM